MQVKSACVYLKENWDESKTLLLNMILDIQNDTSNGNIITDDVRHSLVSYSTESIDNLPSRLMVNVIGVATLVMQLTWLCVCF